jgi:hypothetical protein
MLSLTLRGVRVFGNRVLGRICGPKRDEVAGEWRRLHDEELYDKYSTPNIIRVNFIYIYIPCILIIILFQQMHYTILVFSCPYICFGTPCAILRGVVESLQFSTKS